MSADAWARAVAPLDRARDQLLQRGQEPTDLGGDVIIWYRTAGGVAKSRIAIQPGVADDLPALLSALALEIAWPGTAAVADPAPSGYHAERAVAVWARVWQVRPHADLRVTLHWDAEGVFQADACLRTVEGVEQPLHPPVDIPAHLRQRATRPRVSESPHGLLLAGNRAMEAEDYPTARACYVSATRDLPRHPEAHRNLALALARLGDWEGAAGAMREAQALAPEDQLLGQEYLALETDAGILAAQAGELERAAEHFLRVLSFLPHEPTALVNLGNIRLREGRTREAKAAFQRFLRLHPTHAAAKEIQLALEALSGTE
jgi:hypothetical protein